MEISLQKYPLTLVCGHDDVLDLFEFFPTSALPPLGDLPVFAQNAGFHKTELQISLAFGLLEPPDRLNALAQASPYLGLLY